MVGVVQANADEFTDLSDTGTDPWLAGHDRQAARVEGGERCQAVRAKDLTGDVRHMAREVADLIVGIQQPGFFRTFFAVAQ
ncbi:hypothetical protein D9M69_634830 [compost metagenome]